jgi:serine/threonine-protein kinase RsbW
MNTPAPHSKFSIDFPCSPTWFKTIRQLLVACSREAGFPERVAGQIAMAADEALCNIHRHGYQGSLGDAHMDVSTASEPLPSITIVIDDQAQQIETIEIKSRNLDEVRPGGLGVHLIQTVMDEAIWTKRTVGGMRLTMCKTATNATEKKTTQIPNCND